MAKRDDRPELEFGLVVEEHRASWQSPGEPARIRVSLMKREPGCYWPYNASSDNPVSDRRWYTSDTYKVPRRYVGRWFADIGTDSFWFRWEDEDTKLEDVILLGNECLELTGYSTGYDVAQLEQVIKTLKRADKNPRPTDRRESETESLLRWLDNLGLDFIAVQRGVTDLNAYGRYDQRRYDWFYPEIETERTRAVEFLDQWFNQRREQAWRTKHDRSVVQQEEDAVSA